MIQSTLKPRYSNDIGVAVHETEKLEQEAVFAADMIVRWGMVQGVEDGEDSAGRAKLRLATPEELVNRALECAKLFMVESRKRGLIYVLPSLEEIDKATGTDASKKKQWFPSSSTNE